MKILFCHAYLILALVGCAGQSAHKQTPLQTGEGDAEAQYNLAVAYGKGIGVTQNHQEAVKWLRKAAEQGHPEAQYNLGIAYSKGIGVTQNYQEAEKWFQKAAEQGYVWAKGALKSLRNQTTP